MDMTLAFRIGGRPPGWCGDDLRLARPRPSGALPLARTGPRTVPMRPSRATTTVVRAIASPNACSGARVGSLLKCLLSGRGTRATRSRTGKTCASWWPEEPRRRGGQRTPATTARSVDTGAMRSYSTWGRSARWSCLCVVLGGQKALRSFADGLGTTDSNRSEWRGLEREETIPKCEIEPC